MKKECSSNLNSRKDFITQRVLLKLIDKGLTEKMLTEKFKKLQWTLGTKTRILKTTKKIKSIKSFLSSKEIDKFLNLNTILRILIIFLIKLTNNAKKIIRRKS